MKWTILFIIHGLDEGLHEQSRVLKNAVSYGNWSLKYVNLLYLKSETEYTGKRKSVSVVLNKVNSYKERSDGKPDVTRLKKYSNINIGSKKRLAGIFADVQHDFPSEKLMLIVFDHGAGFGIFEPIPNDDKPLYYTSMNEVDYGLKSSKPKATYKLSVPAISARSINRPTGKNKRAFDKAFSGLPDKIVAGRLRYYGKQLARTDMLTMEELSASIYSGFKRKVDVMVLVNCNMQMVETSYTLRQNVNYLVASESLFWVYGINYREILWRLDNYPYMSPGKVASLCVETMPVRYERIGKLKNLNDVSFSAINLFKMKPVYEKLDQLAAALLANLEESMKKMKKARKVGVDLSQFNYTQDQKDASEPLFYYDLLHLLKGIASDDELVNQVEAQLKKAIIAKHIGSDFKKGSRPLAEGLSIYFPFHPDDFTMQYYDLFYKERARFKADFAATNWGKLIRAIKKRVDQ